jgi:hypothetical protein
VIIECNPHVPTSDGTLCIACGDDMPLYSRGQLINRRAELGSHRLALIEQVASLEKLARKTPPRTLIAEKARVQAARDALPGAREKLARIEAAWMKLREDGY